MKNAICYINQLFAGIGGEDKVGYESEIRDGVMGPTAAINQMLAGIDAQVITTIIYDDNLMNTHRDETIERVPTTLEGREFDLFLAGPVFQASRYRVACGEIGKAVSARFGVPVITSMHVENPGIRMFKKDMYVMTGSHSAASMKKDADAMVKLVDKLLKGQTPERPDAEGYYARRIRHQVWCEGGVATANRAVDMLIARATEQPYQSELITPKKDLVPTASALKDLEHARIALANTGGIVLMDNSDRIQSAFVTRWGRYDISKTDRLADGEFKTIHAGSDPAAANVDPNAIMPVDAMKEFLNGDKHGSLHDYLYSTVGTGTTQGEARRMAKGIIPLLKEDHVDAVIVVSTRGVCICCGLTMVKEFECAGFPVVPMCNLLPAVQIAGVNCTVPTISISYPFGNPSTSKEGQYLLRRFRMETALDALATDIKKQTIFKVEI